MGNDSRSGTPARNAALTVLLRVIRDGQSLSLAREQIYNSLDDARARAFAMQLVQGVLRWRWKLEAMLALCMDRPLRNKEHEVRLVLQIAAFEITTLSTPDYAIVDEAVRLARKRGKKWAAGLVNAVLRKLAGERQAIDGALGEEASLSHPPWLVERIRADWPDDWRSILAANNAQAGTQLRVNRRIASSDRLRQRLADAGVDSTQHELDAGIVVVQGVNVVELPGFDEGWFSVQDAGAQLAAGLLGAGQGQRVLDLCAAPGGKACHLLEAGDDAIELLAVDIDEARLGRVAENLERLHLHASLLQADVSAHGWCRDGDFDCILLDAPCSATGVIRRHPDIKSLRQLADIAPLVEMQRRILANAWPLLKPGGSLLYVTCSILEVENSEQIAGFLESHDDATEIVIDTTWGRACAHGRQLLPGEHDTDGFYYALLRKHRDS